MTDCVRCGRSLPAFSFGDQKDVCSDCVRAATADPPAPEPQARPRRVAATAHPITSALVAINVAVFVLMVLRGVSPTEPTVDQLLRWGAGWGPLTFKGQWWRTLTSAFLHIGVIHLALNMWCLWQLGALAEAIFRRTNYLLLYLLCAFGGGLASLAWHPQVVGAGASGAVFGVAGALISAFYLGHLPIPRPVIKTTLTSLLVFAGYNLAYGAIHPHIDNAAHLGGLGTGLLLGALLGRRLHPQHFAFRRTVFVAVGAGLVIGAFLVQHANGYVVHLTAGDEALHSRRYDAAVREFNLAVAQKPKAPEGYFLLGEALARSNRYAEAERAYLHAIGLDPTNGTAYLGLGRVYLATNRFKPAHTVCTKALDLDTSLTEARDCLARALERLGRDDEAIAAYQTAVTQIPNYAFGYSRLGQLQLRNNRPDLALTALKEAARLQPDNLEYQLGLAAAYRANGMSEDAEATLKKAEELKKN